MGWENLATKQVCVALFSSFCQGHVGWEATIVNLSFSFLFFFTLFKHRQIVFSLTFSFVSYSSSRGFLFFLSFVRVTWEGGHDC